MANVLAAFFVLIIFFVSPVYSITDIDDGTDVIPPGQVAGVIASAKMQVVLTWASPGDDGSENNVTTGMWKVVYTTVSVNIPDECAYNLTISTDWVSGIKCSVSLTGLQPRATYYFWVKARDEDDNWSVWSATAVCIAGSYKELITLIPQVKNGTVAWCDYDGDKELDLAIAGEDGNKVIAKIFRNDNSEFIDIEAPLDGVKNCALAWADCNTDGKMDLVLAGNTGTQSVVKLYLQLETNVFTEQSTVFTAVKNCALSFADIDNDGDPDLLLAGESVAGNVTKIYRNDITGFVEVNSQITGVRNCTTAFGDYDDDGDPDLVISGESEPGFSIMKLYKNEASTFTEQGVTLRGISNGKVCWVDYDIDGKLDILMTGGDSTNNAQTKLYRNTGNGFVDTVISIPGFTNSSLSTGDYDGDGDNDILVAGWSPSGGGIVTKLYKNENGVFTEVITGMPGVYFCSAQFMDFDHDGDLDISLLGQGADDKGNTRVFLSYEKEFGNIPLLISPRNCAGSAVVANSVYGITWGWDDTVVNENGYRVLTEDNVVIKTLKQNSTSYTDTNLVPNTVYTRRIAAFNDFESSGTLVRCYTLTRAPSLLTALEVEPAYVSLTWTPGVGGNSFYGIEKSVDGITYDTVVGFADKLAENRFIDTGVLKNTTYHYKVSGYNGDGVSTTCAAGITLKTRMVGSAQIAGKIVQADGSPLTGIVIQAVREDNSKYEVFTSTDGMYVFSQLPKTVYRIICTWTADDVTAEAYKDGVSAGSADTDFMVEIKYSLATIKGSIGYAQASLSSSYVELIQKNKVIACIKTDSSGKFSINNLLPGTYYIKSFNGVLHSQPQKVRLTEGRVEVVEFVYGLLPANEVYAYPNPAKDGVLVLRFKTGSTDFSGDAKIYAITGELERMISVSDFINDSSNPGVYTYSWDQKNTYGSKVASGVYIYQLKLIDKKSGQESKTKEKVAVIR
ncbi:MAG: FG-GAP-like repeat-containing protein [Elusimicrobiota bacterium]